MATLPFPLLRWKLNAFYLSNLGPFFLSFLSLFLPQSPSFPPPTCQALPSQYLYSSPPFITAASASQSKPLSMTCLDYWNSILTRSICFQTYFLQSIPHNSMVILLNCKLDHTTLLLRTSPLVVPHYTPSSQHLPPSPSLCTGSLFSLLFLRHTWHASLSGHLNKSMSEMLLPSPRNVFFQMSTSPTKCDLCEAVPSPIAVLPTCPPSLSFTFLHSPYLLWKYILCFCSLGIFIQTQIFTYQHEMLYFNICFCFIFGFLRSSSFPSKQNINWTGVYVWFLLLLSAWHIVRAQ